MSSEEEIWQRQQFQREQQQNRQSYSDKARRESQDRQDERDQRHREDQMKRDNRRRADQKEREAYRRYDREKYEAKRDEDRERQREYGREMYETKRQDRLIDSEMKQSMTIAEEKEVTRRETMLLEMGARLYQQKLNADYNQDVRTRNLDIQEFQTRTQIQTESEIKVANNAARNDRREIRENMKSAVFQKIADLKLSEAAKQSAHEQDLERMQAESHFRTTEIREESAANQREEWTRNDAKKDFEEFMVDLRLRTGRMTTQEIEKAVEDLKKDGKI